MKTKGLLKSFKLYFLFFILFYSMVFIYGIYLFVCVCVDVASVGNTTRVHGVVCRGLYMVAEFFARH